MVLICRVVQEALLFAPHYISLLLFRPAPGSVLAAVGACVSTVCSERFLPLEFRSQSVLPVVAPAKRQIYSLVLLVCRFSVCGCLCATSSSGDHAKNLWLINRQTVSGLHSLGLCKMSVQVVGMNLKPEFHLVFQHPMEKPLQVV